MSNPGTSVSSRAVRLALCAVGALLCASQAHAADQGTVSDAQAVYQQDRAACMRGDTNQVRATCLAEAGAAREEATRGAQSGNAQGQFEANRLRRCENLPAQDRDDCIRRMNGEGTTRGSVQSGGIYRELVTPVDPARRD